MNVRIVGVTERGLFMSGSFVSTEVLDSGKKGVLQLTDEVRVTYHESVEGHVPPARTVGVCEFLGERFDYLGTPEVRLQRLVQAPLDSNGDPVNRTQRGGYAIAGSLKDYLKCLNSELAQKREAARKMEIPGETQFTEKLRNSALSRSELIGAEIKLETSNGFVGRLRSAVNDFISANPGWGWTFDEVLDFHTTMAGPGPYAGMGPLSAFMPQSITTISFYLPSEAASRLLGKI